MIRFLKYSLLTVLLCLATIADAQTQNYREMHKVKKGETIFGIAKKYEISIEELIKANPDMNSVGYELKKGDYIFIPYPTGKTATTTSKDKSAQQNKTVAAKTNTVKVGIMLPLHNVDGDGRRMVEYYHGHQPDAQPARCNRLRRDFRSAIFKTSTGTFGIHQETRHKTGYTFFYNRKRRGKEPEHLPGLSES